MDSLTFRKISSAAPAIDYLGSVINRQLRNRQKVLWLVPGGSAMNIAVTAAQNLQVQPNLADLTVTLTDERYGPVGHADSNWQQLAAKGLSLPGARLMPVLNGQSLTDTASRYASMLTQEAAKADYSIALTGMGSDGHIFGIKPASPAVNSRQMAIGYSWDDFRRLTATPQLIKRLDEIVVYAVGEEKWPQINKLIQAVPLSEQPAQLFKECKKVTVYNDCRGD